ncbi:MAG: glycosyltransferase family 2 protein, partial [Rhodanobacteraceae bacterium]
ALQDARGETIFLCDQDDVWHPRKLETMLSQFESRRDLSLLHGDARLVDDNGADLHCTLFQALEMTRWELRCLHASRAFDALLRRNLATGATLSFRRALLRDALPLPRQWLHDEWLAMIASVLGEVDCIEQPLIDYRQHGGNQVGAQARDVAGKIARAAEPRRAYLLGLIERTQVLLQRLRALGGRVPREKLQAVENKLRHLERRAAMPACRACRLPAILREAVVGGYARYALGARALAYDCLGKD